MSKLQFTGEQAQFKPVVRALHLKNFRGFGELNISFEEGLTVFISRNGGGKSTVLDAVWGALEILNGFFGAAEQPSRIGWLGYGDIKNGTEACSITVDVATHYQWLQKEEDEEGRSENVLEEGSKAFQIKVSGAAQGFRLENDLSADWPEFAEYLEGGAQREDSRPIFRYYQSQGTQPESLVENKLEKVVNWIDRRQKVLLQSTNQPFERQVHWLKEAVSSLLSDEEVKYAELKVKYSVEGRDFLNLTKWQEQQAEELSAQQLSSGERTLLEIVADVAISLIEANPGQGESFNPLTDGFGVVLIDEVGMHLHPGWQRNVLVKLQKVFPGVQFIVSTHSALVLNDLSSDHVWLLDDGQAVRPDATFGRDVSTIISKVMDTPSNEFEREYKKIYRLLSRNEISEARASLEKIKTAFEESGDDYSPELKKLLAILDRKKILEK